MSLIPNWATEVMIAKGVGFERAEVKDVIWSYFESQFSEFDCGQNQLEMYFAHMVDTLIKNGDVDKARKHFADISRMETLQPQRKTRPIRRSQLSIFDEKAKRLLARFDDIGDGADLKGLNLFEPTKLDNDQ